MANSSLPLDIQEMLSKYIDSVGLLEALILIFDFPEREWTPEELSRELRSNNVSAAKQLARLAQSGFVLPTETKNAFIYSQQNPNLHQEVERLRTYYKEMSVAVIAYIYSQPQDKLKSFADAFKLRKD